MPYLDNLAGSRFTYSAGTAATVTVPAGVYVIGVTCYSAAGGTLTITPKGPNQNNTAGDTIPIVALAPPFQLPGALFSQLGPGSILAFASTDMYCVTYAKFTSGGP